MTARLSITMPAEIARITRAAARESGMPLSSWIAAACEREAYRQGMARDGAVIVRHGLLGQEWASRQAATIAASRDGT